MFALRNISKRYGRIQANRDISLRFEPGRIYAVMGENGAGKSTLMRILAGHTRPDQGEIEAGGDGPFPAMILALLCVNAGRAGWVLDLKRRYPFLGRWSLGWSITPPSALGEDFDPGQGL